MLPDIPFLGAGLGFRRELKKGIEESAAGIDFLELITDQYIDRPPIKEQEAGALAQAFPLVLHGVDLSIGTDCPIDEEYLEKIHQLADMVKPKWVSDHLCFTRVPGASLAQLTPLSFNDYVVDMVVEHVRKVAATFECPFLIENISYYFTVPPTTMTEAQFITRVIRESGCWFLLDLANVLNNATNNGYDPYEFLDQVPLDRVVQIHLAGGAYRNNVLIDTHSHPVHPEAFDMLRYTLPRMPNLKGVLIERDQNYPPIEELVEELDRTREIIAEHWSPHHAARPSGAALGAQAL